VPAFPAAPEEDEEYEKEEEEDDAPGLLLSAFSKVEKARRTISASSEMATRTGCPNAGSGVVFGSIEQIARVVGETIGGGGVVSIGPGDRDFNPSSEITRRLLRSAKELAP